MVTNASNNVGRPTPYEIPRFLSPHFVLSVARNREERVGKPDINDNKESFNPLIIKEMIRKKKSKKSITKN